jgi:predicted amidophosphoribosyltransferase
MKTNLKQIFGNWDLGYALDKHTLRSTYIGDNEYGHPQFNTERSEPGEALFQLKYRSDWDQAKVIAHAIAANAYPKFANVGLIVPMPASKARQRQPVTEIARELAAIVKLNCFEDILRKATTGRALKDIGSKDERAKVLAGAITLNDEIREDGRWNVLLVDDLYDTGASLEAATTVLRTYKKIGRIYVAAVSW